MKTRKVRKIKYKKLLIFLIVLIILMLAIYKLVTSNINSIYILNNKYLTKNEILNILNIDEDTKLINTFFLEEKLEKNKYVLNCEIKHKNIYDIYIEIEENVPLYYNDIRKETILSDGNVSDKKYAIPNLITDIPETQKTKFNKEIKKVDINILGKISEIAYKPSDLDKNLFILSMTDGNYVYLTLDRFDNINTYLDIMNKLETKISGKKGILYLDSGNYFQVL